MRRKFFLTAAAALESVFSAICFACSPIAAQAKAASSYREGVEASGLMVKGESSSIIVENERLHFKIASLPREGQIELNDYNAAVTTAYTFYNSRNSQADMSVLFPFGAFPSYMAEGTEDEISSLLVDDEAAECSVRYTYSSATFDPDRDVERVLEERKTDDFYRSPTASVREYGVLLTAPVDTNDCYVRIKLTYNAKRTRVLFPAGNVRLSVSDGDMYAYLTLNATENSTAVFYAVGDSIPSENITPELYQSGDNMEVYVDPVRDFAFEELAMMHWSKESGVSETDWYNAFVDMLNDKSVSGGSVANFSLGLGDFTRWYECKLHFAARQRIVCKVTAPLFPAIEGAENARYEYSYLLSPSSKWARVSNFEICIETPYFLSNASVTFEDKNASGEYRFTRSSLPQGELIFVLTEENGGSGINVFGGNFLWPTLTWAFGVLAALTVLSGFIALAVILFLRNKRRR